MPLFTLPCHPQGARSDHRAQDPLDQHGVSGAPCPQLATAQQETRRPGGRFIQVPVNHTAWVREIMHKQQKTSGTNASGGKKRRGGRGGAYRKAGVSN